MYNSLIYTKPNNGQNEKINSDKIIFDNAFDVK